MKRHILLLPLIFTCFFSIFPFFQNLEAQKSDLIQSDSVYIFIDMNPAVASGIFRPQKDTFEFNGTMTSDWILIDSVGPGYTYKSSYLLQDNGLHFVELRIRARDSIITADTAYARDTIYYENIDRATRYFRVGDSTQTLKFVFNNYYPGKVPMVFDCNMSYQIFSGKFSAALDYLDINGNFNDWGAQRIELFPRYIDSIYSITLYYDSLSLPTDTLKFKFRFNGNDSTMESDSLYRNYYITATNHNFSAWYDDIHPSDTAKPFVSSVAIQDSIYPGHIVTGVYRYEDYNFRPEGKSEYQWYSADQYQGALTKIDTATKINYKVDTTLVGKFLVFEVTPITNRFVRGYSGRAWSEQKVYMLGTEDLTSQFAKIYPNPVSETLKVVILKPSTTLQILDINGRQILSRRVSSNEMSLDVSGLSAGVYLFKITDQHFNSKISKIIKN